MEISYKYCTYFAVSVNISRFPVIYFADTSGPCPVVGGVKIPASYPKQADPTACGIATLTVLAARANVDPTDTRIYAVFEPSSGKVFRVNADDFYAGAPSARVSMGHWKNVLCAVVSTE